MEFLYRLYSNNYFGIGLFIVITILAFAFLVILFFGKKDEKARMEMEKLETIASEALADKKIETETENQKEDLESISLTEDIESPQELNNEISIDNFTTNSEEEKGNDSTLNELEFEEEPIASNNLDLDLDFDMDLNKEDILLEEPMNTYEEEKDTEVFNLDAKIEDDTFDNIPSYRDNYREEPSVDHLSYREDSLDTEFVPRNENTEFSIDENNIIEEPPVRKPMPNVFSSVYKNNEREELANVGLNLDTEESANTINSVIKEEPSVEKEPIQEIKPIAPKKPEFVLPKRADMPKLNKNTENNNDNIIKF